MDWSRFIDWIKLSPKHLLALAAASSFLIFVKSDWLQRIGLTEFRNKYFPWIGIVALLSTALLLSHLLTRIGSWIYQESVFRINLRRWRRYLHTLTLGEKEVLRRFINKNTKTQRLDDTSGVVQGLAAMNIIGRASNITLSVRPEFDYNIQPWAWDYLKKHPNLLK